MIIKKQGYISENDIPLDIRQKTPAVSDSGLAGLEKEVIRNALRETGNNISKTAKILGIGRGALRYKMKKYGIAVE
jgi:DNA-binding NtrC family response regulator